VSGQFDYWKQFPKTVENPFGDCVHYTAPASADVIFGSRKSGGPAYAYTEPATFNFVNQDWGKFRIAPVPLAGTVKYVAPTKLKYTSTYTVSVLEEFADSTPAEMLFPRAWYELARAELHNWLASNAADNLSTLSYPKLVNWTVNVAWLCTSMLLATNLYPLFWSDAVRMAGNPKWTPANSLLGWDQGFFWAAKTYEKTIRGSGPLVLKADGSNDGCVTGANTTYKFAWGVPALHPFDEVSFNFTNLSWGNSCSFKAGEVVTDPNFFQKDQFWWGPQSGIHPFKIWQNIEHSLTGPVSGSTEKNYKEVRLNGVDIVRTHNFFDHFPWAGLYASSSVAGSPSKNFDLVKQVDQDGSMGLALLFLRAGLFGGLQHVFNTGCTLINENKVPATASTCYVNSDLPMRGSAEKFKRIGGVLHQVDYDTMVRTGVAAWQIRNTTLYVANDVSPPLAAIAREDMQKSVDKWTSETKKTRRLLGTAAGIKFVQGLIKLFTDSDFYAYAKAVQDTVKLGDRAFNFKITNVPWDSSRDMDPIFIRIYKGAARINPLDKQIGTLTSEQKDALKQVDAVYPGAADGTTESATFNFFAKLITTMPKLEAKTGVHLWTTPQKAVVQTASSQAFEKAKASPGSTVGMWLLFAAVAGGGAYLVFGRRGRS
jgi:hypothetical protein